MTQILGRVCSSFAPRKNTVKSCHLLRKNQLSPTLDFFLQNFFSVFSIRKEAIFLIKDIFKVPSRFFPSSKLREFQNLKVEIIKLTSQISVRMDILTSRINLILNFLFNGFSISLSTSLYLP